MKVHISQLALSSAIITKFKFIFKPLFKLGSVEVEAMMLETVVETCDSKNGGI
jgi:hypothetical protein